MLHRPEVLILAQTLCVSSPNDPNWWSPDGMAPNAGLYAGTPLESWGVPPIELGGATNFEATVPATGAQTSLMTLPNGVHLKAECFGFGGVGLMLGQPASSALQISGTLQQESTISGHPTVVGIDERGAINREFFNDAGGTSLGINVIARARHFGGPTSQWAHIHLATMGGDPCDVSGIITVPR